MLGLLEKDIPPRYLDEERFAQEASSSGAQVGQLLFVGHFATCSPILLLSILWLLIKYFLKFFRY